jgi:hypothetical protein
MTAAETATASAANASIAGVLSGAEITSLISVVKILEAALTYQLPISTSGKDLAKELTLLKARLAVP